MKNHLLTLRLHAVLMVYFDYYSPRVVISYSIDWECDDSPNDGPTDGIGKAHFSSADLTLYVNECFGLL